MPLSLKVFINGEQDACIEVWVEGVNTGVYDSVIIDVVNPIFQK
jgi:hypothetical protein